jgi:hypothetical protein
VNPKSKEHFIPSSLLAGQRVNTMGYGTARASALSPWPSVEKGPIAPAPSSELPTLLSNIASQNKARRQRAESGPSVAIEKESAPGAGETHKFANFATLRNPSSFFDLYVLRPGEEIYRGCRNKLELSPNEKLQWFAPDMSTALSYAGPWFNAFRVAFESDLHKNVPLFLLSEVNLKRLTILAHLGGNVTDAETTAFKEDLSKLSETHAQVTTNGNVMNAKRLNGFQLLPLSRYDSCTSDMESESQFSMHNLRRLLLKPLIPPIVAAADPLSAQICKIIEEGVATTATGHATLENTFRVKEILRDNRVTGLQLIQAATGFSVGEPYTVAQQSAVLDMLGLTVHRTLQAQNMTPGEHPPGRISNKALDYMAFSILQLALERGVTVRDAEVPSAGWVAAVDGRPLPIAFGYFADCTTIPQTGHVFPAEMALSKDFLLPSKHISDTTDATEMTMGSVNGDNDPKYMRINLYTKKSWAIQLPWGDDSGIYFAAYPTDAAEGEIEDTSYVTEVMDRVAELPIFKGILINL